MTILVIICKVIFVSAIVNAIAAGGLILSTWIHEANEEKDIVDYDY